MAYMWYAGIGLLGRTEVQILLLLRGFGGFLGVFGIYHSLAYLSMTEAADLTFLAPMLSCYIYSLLQPSEPFPQRQQIAFFLSMVGVIFIAHPISFFHSIPPTSEAQPTLVTNSTLRETEPSQTPSKSLHPTSPQRLFATILGLLLGIIGRAMTLVTIRMIGKRAHPLISINYFATCCIIVSTVSFVIFPDVNSRFLEDIQDLALLFVAGISGFVMQILLTAGLAYSPAEINAVSNAPPRATDTYGAIAVSPSSGSRATSMLYTQILFSILFDKAILGLDPDTWSLAGSGMILGSVVWANLVNDIPTKTSTICFATDPATESEEMNVRAEA